MCMGQSWRACRMRGSLEMADMDLLQLQIRCPLPCQVMMRLLSKPYSPRNLDSAGTGLDCVSSKRHILSLNPPPAHPTVDLRGPEGTSPSVVPKALLTLTFLKPGWERPPLLTGPPLLSSCLLIWLPASVVMATCSGTKVPLVIGSDMSIVSM